MLPSLAKQVSSVARGTRQWEQRRQPQCHARSAALRYQRSAISLPQPPQPRTPSVTPPPPPPPLLPSFAPICRLFAPPPPSPGGGVVLPQPTSFSISFHARRYDACRCILQVVIASFRDGAGVIWTKRHSRGTKKATIVFSKFFGNDNLEFLRMMLVWKYDESCVCMTHCK